MTLATTQQGVAAQDIEAAGLTEDDAAAALLSKWSEEDPETASESPEEDDNQEVDETPEDEAEEAQEDAEETEDHPEEDSEEADEAEEDSEAEEEPKKALDDEAVVKVKVGDEELDVPVKDLKRLYGQEAALTRKSQEVAAKRKQADEQIAKTQVTLEKMYQKAAERWKPYAEVDMLLASKTLDTEQFAALRKEAQAAFEDFRFITQEVDGFIKETKQQQQQALQEQAKEAVKVLKEVIPEWSPKLYDSIREYAIGKGLDAEIVNNLVDPAAIQLIHKARLYDEAKKVTTKKVVKTPKKVLKQTTTTSTKDVQGDPSAKARAKLKTSGSVDDAAALLLSRWASADE